MMCSGSGPQSESRYWLGVAGETLWESFLDTLPHSVTFPFAPLILQVSDSLSLPSPRRKLSLTLLVGLGPLILCLNKPLCFFFGMSIMTVINYIMILFTFLSLSKGARGQRSCLFCLVLYAWGLAIGLEVYKTVK